MSTFITLHSRLVCDGGDHEVDIAVDAIAMIRPIASDSATRILLKVFTDTGNHFDVQETHAEVRQLIRRAQRFTTTPPQEEPRP